MHLNHHSIRCGWQQFLIAFCGLNKHNRKTLSLHLLVSNKGCDCNYFQHGKLIIGVKHLGEWWREELMGRVQQEPWGKGRRVTPSHLGYHITSARMIHWDAGLSLWPPWLHLHSLTLKVTRLLFVPESTVCWHRCPCSGFFGGWFDIYEDRYSYQRRLAWKHILIE